MKTLLEETVALVNKSGISPEALCDEMESGKSNRPKKWRGIKIRSRWLRMVIDGSFEDPGVNKIEFLNHHMKTRAN